MLPRVFMQGNRKGFRVEEITRSGLGSIDPAVDPSMLSNVVPESPHPESLGKDLELKIHSRGVRQCQMIRSGFRSVGT